MDPTSITEKNIRSIYEREKEERAKSPLTHRMADRVATFFGTVAFAIINALFFTIWIVLNETITKFDPYPFVFLMLIVSLEAIFLSIVVLISQNEMAKHTERRHQLDLQVNLLAEQENTAMAKLMVEIARKLGVEESKLSEVIEMACDTQPEDVLSQIVEAEQNEIK